MNGSAGQSITVANINSGNLTFTPAANANGAGYASFTFQVVYNVSMSAGLAPVKGLTLPLMSYGGSSVIATLAGLLPAWRAMRVHPAVALRHE